MVKQESNPVTVQPGIDEEIDIWAQDLIGNLPTLRETDNHNVFKTAIADLKKRIA